MKQVAASLGISTRTAESQHVQIGMAGAGGGGRLTAELIQYAISKSDFDLAAVRAAKKWAKAALSL